MINKNTTKWSLVCLSSLFLISCDTDFSEPVGDSSNYTTGDADFSHYVSVGDSLTAGYADAALYRSGQENSYPNILATQFKTVGGGAFIQPLMNDDNLGGLLFATAANPDFANRLILNAATSSPEPIAGTPTDEVIIGAPILSGTFNNMGVPGAKSFHLGAPGYGSAAGLGTGTSNPYFVRFASEPTATSTVIGDAAGQAPTFFTIWIGNNDVLSYATGGGAGIDQLGNFDPASYGSSDITDPNVFASTFAGLVGALTLNPATKGVLINIPDVSTIPYFTTVPHNPVPLDQATADALNAAFAAYNTNLQGLVGIAPVNLTQSEADQRTITFTAGLNNALLISDENLSDLTIFNAALVNMRQATADDLIVLPTSSKIGTLADPGNPSSAWGIAVPLLDADVLISSEVALVETARTAFNTTIKAVADANPNLAFYDASAFMAELKANGINYGTGNITATYATGGGFSLDGVHPTARGYAVIANDLINTINTAFNATIPKVDPGARTTIFLK